MFVQPKVCRWCKGDVTGRRRTFCSDACVHEWRLRSSTSYLRKCVKKRDRGICAICNFNAVAERRRIMKLPFAERMKIIRELQDAGRIPKRRKSWWDADHIRPVREGGDSNLDNIRTLCWSCHRIATRLLRKRLKFVARP